MKIKVEDPKIAEALEIGDTIRFQIAGQIVCLVICRKYQGGQRIFDAVRWNYELPLTKKWFKTKRLTEGRLANFKKNLQNL